MCTDANNDDDNKAVLTARMSGQCEEFFPRLRIFSEHTQHCTGHCTAV